MDNSKAIELLKGVAVYADTEFKAALNLGIAALEQQEKAFDEWCTDCKEYDKEQHCCHRFTKVIRQAVEEHQRERLRDLPSAQPEPEHTMEEFMYGQDMGNPEDGSL